MSQQDPGNIGSEKWSNMSKGSQREAITKRVNKEKPEFDAAREQRSIYSVLDDDPDFQEIEESQKNMGNEKGLAKSPHHPTRIAQAGSDPMPVIGLKWKRKG